MNYYQQRLEALKDPTLPPQVHGQGDISKSNEFFLNLIKVGDVVFVNGWILRDIHDISTIVSIAKNGLTVEEISYINDPNGEWKMGRWQHKKFKAFWFKECERVISEKWVIGQYIWKIERKGKIIYESKK